MSNSCWINAFHMIIKRDRCSMHPAMYDEDSTSRFHSDMHHPQVPWQVSLPVGPGHMHLALLASRGPSSSTTGIFHNSRVSRRWMILCPQDRGMDGIGRLLRPQVVASLLTAFWVLTRAQLCVYHKNVLHLIVYSIKAVCHMWRWVPINFQFVCATGLL